MHLIMQVSRCIATNKSNFAYTVEFAGIGKLQLAKYHVEYLPLDGCGGPVRREGVGDNWSASGGQLCGTQ